MWNGESDNWEDILLSIVEIMPAYDDGITIEQVRQVTLYNGISNA